VEGEGCSARQSLFSRVGLGSRYGAVATLHTRMDAVLQCRRQAVRHGVEVVRAGSTAAVHAKLQRLSAIDRIPATVGGCVESMHVWRACGCELFDALRPETSGREQRCDPLTLPGSHPPSMMSRCTRVSHAARAHPGTLPHRISNPRSPPGTPCGVRGAILCMSRRCAWPGLADVAWIAAPQPLAALDALGFPRARWMTMERTR
jgi:hypothetical protein